MLQVRDLTADVKKCYHIGEYHRSNRCIAYEMGHMAGNSLANWLDTGPFCIERYACMDGIRISVEIATHTYRIRRVVKHGP